MVKIDRYAEVLYALDNIANKSPRLGQYLNYGVNLRAFHDQPTRHDKPYIPGTDDHDLFTRQQSLYIYQFLGKRLAAVEFCRTRTLVESQWYRIGVAGK